MGTRADFDQPVRTRTAFGCLMRHPGKFLALNGKPAGPKKVLLGRPKPARASDP